MVRNREKWRTNEEISIWTPPRKYRGSHGPGNDVTVVFLSHVALGEREPGGLGGVEECWLWYYRWSWRGISDFPGCGWGVPRSFIVFVDPGEGLAGVVGRMSWGRCYRDFVKGLSPPEPAAHGEARIDSFISSFAFAEWRDRRRSCHRKRTFAFSRLVSGSIGRRKT